MHSASPWSGWPEWPPLADGSPQGRRQHTFAILRSFLQSFPRPTVAAEDFIGLLNFVTKEEWHPFFDRYAYGTELPEKSKKLDYLRSNSS